MLLSGLLALLLGVLMLAWPSISIVAAAVVVGAYLLITGVAPVGAAFSPEVSVGGRVVLFLSGATSLILAVLAFDHSDDAALLATLAGIGFLLPGIAFTVSAISDPILPGRGWNVLFGAVSVIAATVVLSSQVESVRTLVLVIGTWLVVVGVFEVVAARGVRSADSRQRLRAAFGDIRMLCHDVGLMNPIAVSMWRICKIDGPPSQYRSEPARAPLPTRATDA
jgi:uncharacterized membrane protein HdeD (DUF308 family)